MRERAGIARTVQVRLKFAPLANAIGPGARRDAPWAGMRWNAHERAGGSSGGRDSKGTMFLLGRTQEVELLWTATTQLSEPPLFLAMEQLDPLVGIPPSGKKGVRAPSKGCRDSKQRVSGLQAKGVGTPITPAS